MEKGIIMKRIVAITICSAMAITATFPISQADAAKSKKNKKIPSIVSTIKDNTRFELRNNLVKNFENHYAMGKTPKMALTEEKSYPNPVKLKWKTKYFKALKYIVSVSESETMENASRYSTKDNFLQIYNLKTNMTYYWTVKAVAKKTNVKSEVYTFKTKKGIRTIKLDGVSNVRDIGGWKAKGGRIKQGMVYRTATLDGITNEGRKEAVNRLKIKTDIDLREPGEDSAGKGVSPLGSKVKYLNIGGIMYNNIWGTELQKNTISREIKLFANEKNYPIAFHCTYGRDRTGTLAFLINGYLGVKKADLFKDYEMLLFATRGCMGQQEPAQIVDWLKTIYNRINMYGDSKDKYSKKVELFLLDAGVSKKCLKKVKNILVEKN